MMSAEQWFEAASGFMSEEQRNAFRQVKAAMPAGVVGKAQMEKFSDLNGRIKAALPLDPPSEQAQRFLAERDAMLQPFLALMLAQAKEASKNLREKISQGKLALPIDAEVDRFHKEAARARDERGKRKT